jgi:GT2 family glycosyltransferase
VAQAQAPIVVFANDDVSADASTVLRLADAVESGVADVAVPRVFTPDGSVEPTIAPLPTPFRIALEWLLLPDKAPRKARAPRDLVQKWRRPFAVEGIDAAAAIMVAAKRTLLQREPLPDAYFLYWEESEWFWRLHSAGVRVAYLPDVHVTHAAGRADVRTDKSRLLARNAVRCVRRTQGRGAAARAWPIVVLWQTRLVLTSILRPGRHAMLPARRAGLRAALSAWREI